MIFTTVWNTGQAGNDEGNSQASHVSFHRNDGWECYFLGKEGCVFCCKPIFCVSYNCRDIKENASLAEQSELDRATAQLLAEQIRFEECLQSFLREFNGEI